VKAATNAPEASVQATPRWPWFVFALAALWVVLTRIPLILNAENHLDSDLAVDGLTLLDVTHGHWRWHYPATPFMGIGPVFFSLPQALIWGANPITLVSGGTVAFLCLLLATFVLAWRAFDERVACWSLLPLVFGSTGAVWLSGRVTGGHLTASVWHAGAFALLAQCLRQGKTIHWLSLGLWCGLGVALDPMFGLTLAGLVPSALVGAIMLSGFRRSAIVVLLLGGTFLVGLAPRYIGERLDPLNAYPGQFTIDFRPELIAGHARILRDQCLPRLIAGHQLPNFESDPEPSAANGGMSPLTRRSETSALGVVVVVISGLALGVAGLGLAGAGFDKRTRAGRYVAWGLLISSAATLGGFVANRNIFNSDNYRYLVDLLVPYSVGFGLAMSAISRLGRKGLVCSTIFALVFAILMTADLQRWYARFGWVEGFGSPVKKYVGDPTLAWLIAHPEITWINGDYWDVYRLVFLTSGRVKGQPDPIYPNRFPEWHAGGGNSQAILIRLGRPGVSHLGALEARGWKIVQQARGVLILTETGP
jgi:hypothetical protein